MKTCNACRAGTTSDKGFCPLCGEPLADGAGACAVLAGPYPDLSLRSRSYSFVHRLLLFLSLLLCGLSVLINLLVTPSFLWCLIVIAASIYAWATVPPLLRRGTNFAARAFVQVLLTSALVIALDLIIGWRGWSATYVIPALVIGGITVVAVMMLLGRTSRARYILYQVLMAVFGFAPLVLYLTGLATNLPMAIVATGLALASLLATIIFGERTLKDELGRRFHF